MNEIASLKTINVAAEGAPSSAILIAINVGDADTLPRFVLEVAEKMKVQRMLSPPDTTLLVISAIGKLDVREFARLWREVTERDEVLRAFMQMMVRADLVRGTRDGQVLATASLLPPVPKKRPWWNRRS